MKKILVLVTAFLLFQTNASLAEEDLNYNLINLQAEATRQIDNDILVVLMSSLAEANSAREAASTVNNDVSWAMEIINKSSNIKSQTRQYQTRPLYKNRTITGWVVSQQIRLESRKIEELTNLVGTLQEKLGVSSMQFEIAPERRSKAVDELIQQALSAFQAKAQLITSTLGAKDYRLVNISVSENNPQVAFRHAYQADEMSAQAARAPQVEAGESSVSVNAGGTIQLVF